MYNVVSLFSGAMGLDLGLEKAGFQTRLCVDNDKHACETIRINRPHMPLIEADIRQIEVDQALQLAGLTKEEIFLVCGGPPCQPFSTAGKRASIGDPRGSLFTDFVRFIAEIRPPFFIMENVRGILSAAIKHRPLDKRDGSTLHPHEELGSALRVILDEFEHIGYNINYQLLMAADYGVPQIRQRVIFIGSRDGYQVSFPEPTHTKMSENGRAWVTLGEGLADLHDPIPVFPNYSQERLDIYRMLKSGENWRNLPIDVQKRALGGAYHSTGGRVGFYRRLSYDKPSPTILTSVIQKASGMCHPEELRPLSIAECARLQQFPDDWIFSGKMNDQYRQIGNAVPVGLGEAIGKHLLYVYEQHVYEHVQLKMTI